jgi:hypothetical protein
MQEYGDSDRPDRDLEESSHPDQTAVRAVAEGYADFIAGRYLPFEKADAKFRKKHGIKADS